MRLTTIWTIPHMALSERFRQSGDAIVRTLGHKLPLRMRYWVTLGELAKATMGSENIPETTFDEILKNLDAPKSLR